MNTKATFVLALSSLLFSSSVGYAESVQLRSSDVNEEISLERAWERFVKVCGLAISDPADYLARLPETGPVGEKGRAEHGDENLVTVNILNGRIWEYTTITRFGSAVGIDCSFHYMTPEKIGAEELGQQFLPIMTSEPDWEFVGGNGVIEYPDFSGRRSFSKHESPQYSILNVWGRKDVSVQVIFQDSLVYWGVKAINRS